MNYNNPDAPTMESMAAQQWFNPQATNNANSIFIGGMPVNNGYYNQAPQNPFDNSRRNMGTVQQQYDQYGRPIIPENQIVPGGTYPPPGPTTMTGTALNAGLSRRDMGNTAQPSAPWQTNQQAYVNQAPAQAAPYPTCCNMYNNYTPTPSVSYNPQTNPSKWDTPNTQMNILPPSIDWNQYNANNIQPAVQSVPPYPQPMNNTAAVGGLGQPSNIPISFKDEFIKNMAVTI